MLIFLFICIDVVEYTSRPLVSSRLNDNTKIKKRLGNPNLFLLIDVNFYLSQTLQLLRI